MGSIQSNHRVELVCVDQDKDALEFSKRELSHFKSCMDISFIHGNILKLEQLDIDSKTGFDIIYSIGIADYLEDRMLTKIFQDCFNMLRPGGRIIVAYKDKDKHKPLGLNWFADWYFIPRSEQEFVALSKKALNNRKYSIDIRREPQTLSSFLKLPKNNN